MQCSAAPAPTEDGTVIVLDNRFVCTDRLRLPLDAASLRSDLTGPGSPWRQIDVVAETGSTNADLLARVRAGANVENQTTWSQTAKKVQADPLTRKPVIGARSPSCV